MVFLNKSLLNSSTARRHALTGKGERERRTAFLNLQSSFSASSCSQSFVSFSPSSCLQSFVSFSPSAYISRRRTSGMGSQDRGGEGGGEGRQVPSGG